MHATSRPEIGDRLLTITSQPPKRNWADPSLEPGNQEGRLFCQTLLPRDYKLILHGEGRVAAFDPAGKSSEPVDGNAYHRKYGQHVMQIDPGNVGTQTVFLHVLTATDGGETTPPEAAYRVSGPGQIEITVDGTGTCLTAPEWFAPFPCGACTTAPQPAWASSSGSRNNVPILDR